MLVVNRFRVPPEAAVEFRADVDRAHALLAEQPGYLDGVVGRNVDDPVLWVLSVHWANPGSYRRALSAYDVKVGAVPLLSRAVDEASAYEIVEAGTVLNVSDPRRT